MKLWIVLIVVVIIVSNSDGAPDFERPTHNLLAINYMVIEELDKTVCNLTLTMKKIRNKIGEFTFDLHLFVPIHYARGTGSLLIKRSSNAYQPTVLNNISLELCAIVKNNATLLASTKFISVVYPGMFEALKDYIHPCPYLPGRYFIKHTVDSVFIPRIMEPRDYKAIVRVSDAKNKTLGAGYGSITIKQGYPVSNQSNKKKKPKI